LINKLSHIALILDGNKRWAKINNHTKLHGYTRGFENIRNLVSYSIPKGISNLTLFTLSSENFNRPSINIIYDIIYDNFNKTFTDLVNDKGVKIKIFGSRNNLPNKIIEIFKKASEPDYIIFADNFQFDPIKKDILKSNKYRWNNQEKIWFKNVKYDELEAQKEWLTSIIYDSFFEGRVQQINPVDKYKL